MKERITFIGKKIINDHERSSLHLFGLALYAYGVQLQTSSIGQANQAVTEGYTDGGGTPTLRKNGILELVTEGAIVFPDDELTKLLETHASQWTATNNPVWIMNTDELFQYTESILAQVKMQEITT